MIKSLLSLHVGASEEIGKQAATKIRQTLIRQGMCILPCPHFSVFVSRMVVFPVGC